MSYINWNNDYSVKIVLFDNHHQQLVALINELHDAIEAGNEKAILSNIILQLVEYTKYHFKAEEAYFHKLDYPMESEHKEEHEKFVNEILSFQQKFEEGKMKVSEEIMSFLKKWLMGHIMGSDQKYSEFFHEKGIS